MVAHSHSYGFLSHHLTIFLDVFSPSLVSTYLHPSPCSLSFYLPPHSPCQSLSLSIALVPSSPPWIPLDSWRMDPPRVRSSPPAKVGSVPDDERDHCPVGVEAQGPNAIAVSDRVHFVAMFRAWEEAQQAMAGCFASWRHMWTSSEDNMHGKRVRIGERVLVLGESVGEGASAYVRIATEDAPRPSKRKLALKRVLLQSEEQLEDVQLEIQAWETFARAPHVLRLIDWDIRPVKRGTNATAKEALMLFPLYEDGSLQELGGGREPLEAMQTFLQVAKALENLHNHEPPHAHRDVKPGNVLVRLSNQEEGDRKVEKVVLTDLGSCRPARMYIRSRRDALYLMEDAAQRCTAPYRAPELFDVSSHCDVDERIDVWSIGCLLYFMMHGRSPFEPRADELGASVAMAVLSAKVEFPDERDAGAWVGAGRAAYPQGMKDLVRFCLNVDPAERPRIDQVIQRAEQVLESLQKGEGS